MAKNADYYISEVAYNQEHTHIEQLKRHTVSEDNTYGAGEFVPRENVVRDIERLVTYKVIYKQNGIMYLGKKLEIYDYEGTKYLRTDKDKIAADNLENLI